MQSMSQKSNTMSSLENLRNLPTIPKVMFEVSSLLKENPINNHKLCNTIGKDQGLTTKILTIANSPLYGLQRKVSSLEFAILLLGAEELESIVTAVSLSDTIKFNASSTFKYMEYWKHSMLVGTAARDIARRLGMPELAGDAFLAGMMHDVGIQLIIKYFPNQYDQILKTVEDSKISFLEAEQKILDATHQEIGKFLAQKWSLPQGLCDVLEYHHRPQDAKQNTMLVSIVHLTDYMTQQFECGHSFWDNNVLFDPIVSDILGFSSVEELGSFTADYKEVFEDAAESLTL